MLVVLAVWIAGQIVTQGVSDALQIDHPTRAVAWRGDSSDALSQLALRRAAAGDYGRTILYARRALLLSPLNVVAQSAFGLALDREGQHARADQILTIAGKRGWRDAVTQIWLFQHRLLEGHYAEGYDRADALLRRNNNFNPYMFRALAMTAQSPQAVGQLSNTLRTAPSWRTDFLAYLSADPQPTSAQTADAILQSLAAGPTPPADKEIGPYVNRLIHEQRFVEARAAWSRLSRRHQTGAGGLYDGDFETAPGPTPFDWTLTDGVGWTANLSPAPGAGHGQALRLAYDGVSQPRLARQRLVLPGGGYQLSGQVFVESGSNPGRIQWLVTCESNNAILARIPMPAAPGQWRAFSGRFQTPADGCPSQWLRLTADPEDIENDMVIWFDNLSISPATVVTPVLTAETITSQANPAH